MHATSLAVMSAGLLILAILGLGTRAHALKRSYYAGVNAWSRWLPVAATGVYLAVLAVNLATGGSVDGSGLSLDGFFSVPEIIILFLVGPLFLTRVGNLLAALTVAYCIERLALTQAAGPAGALYLVVGAVTVVAALGDKMPWLVHEGPNHLAHRLREILLVALTIGALAVLFMGLVKVHGFNRWTAASLGVSLGLPGAMGLMIALFIGWLSVALGFTRHLTLPVLALPTLFVTAYVTALPTHLLVVPFALCFALSLGTAERRVQGVRRTIFDGMFHARVS